MSLVVYTNINKRGKIFFKIYWIIRYVVLKIQITIIFIVIYNIMFSDIDVQLNNKEIGGRIVINN